MLNNYCAVFETLRRFKTFSGKKIIAFKVVTKKHCFIKCTVLLFLIFSVGYSENILLKNSDFDNNYYFFLIIKSLLYLIKNEFASYNVK